MNHINSNKKLNETNWVTWFEEMLQSLGFWFLRYNSLIPAATEMIP